MLPIHKIIWHEWRAEGAAVRVPEPEAMVDPAQIRAYIQAYEWGGPTSALQLYHLRRLSRMIRRGDTVLDLACGPGPLLLELASLYPECRFIGADLSEPMLAALRERAGARGLKNIETLCEDIRYLPSVAEQSVDVVISTSALHHLPDIASLRATFDRVKAVIKPAGQVYIFDFGLLKTQQARDLMVTEVGKLAPPVTTRDYDLSLRAAFPIRAVFDHAQQVFGGSVQRASSSFVDFFYFLSTSPVLPSADSAVEGYLRRIRQEFSMAAASEYSMLRLLQRRDLR